MGHWGENPWDNDSAGDWFADFMDGTNIRQYVLDTIKHEYEDGFYSQLDEIYAAISVFMMLGRIYIWPIEQYDEDLAAILSRARELKRLLTTDPDIGDRFPSIDQDIAILAGRLEENRQHRVSREARWPWGMD